ncbi:DUF413 domain-containing protein [Alteromonas aestuariivivens]|uniref:Macrodomain Ori protein n=1 Tax=Alteromonas aestuariivivens TaxID=1938339 RepID=A0A3D8M9X5_9ALTE|nr:DUF413 domain-containing protein [Alteromonas aestuariivivens]RDV26664.1 DUF413 domain-containing protein [Alteromonas aestuariivivens]
MAKFTRDMLLKRPFVDRKHYPYGFARSGDFSISESKALTQYGSLIAALVDGELGPDNDVDQGYLESALGHRTPQSVEEKAWLKYQSRINRPKAASIYGSKKAAVDDDDDDIRDDDDIEIEIDSP